MNNRTIFSLIITALLLTSTTPMNANPFSQWWRDRNIASKRENILTRGAKLEEKNKVIAEEMERQEERIKEANKKISLVAKTTYEILDKNIKSISEWMCNQLDRSNLGTVVRDVNLGEKKTEIKTAMDAVLELLKLQLEEYQSALSDDASSAATVNYSRAPSTIGVQSYIKSNPNAKLANLMRQNSGNFESEDRVTPWVHTSSSYLPSLVEVANKETQTRNNRFQQTAQKAQAMNAFRTSSTTPTTTSPRRFSDWGYVARSLQPSLRSAQLRTPAEQAVF